jgi:hypothetical protein
MLFPVALALLIVLLAGCKAAYSDGTAMLYVSIAQDHTADQIEVTKSAQDLSVKVGGYNSESQQMGEIIGAAVGRALRESTPAP